MTTVLVVLFILLDIPVVAGVLIYNRLVTLRNRVRNGFVQIDVQLKRRYDLIPNLVETAKGYLKHERETLEEVTRARATAMAAAGRAAADPADAAAITGLAGAEGLLGGALGRLMATVENYPDLKASQTMLRLMEELTSTENKVAFARQAYNDAVMTFNTGIETFPAVLVAGPFGFRAAAPFELTDAGERAPVKVQLT